MFEHVREANSSSVVPPYPETSEPVLTRLPEPKKGGLNRLKEEAGEYPNVVLQLNDRWRVIVCKDGTQWVLQCKRGDRWSGDSYCRTRDGLFRSIQKRVPSEQSLLDSPDLRAFPERIGHEY